MSKSWKSSGRRPIVGIIGGGQLARMLIQASISLDVDVHVLALEKDESLKSLAANYEVVADYSPATLYQFSRKCDVVTFEHELVDHQTVEELENRGCNLLPGSTAFRVATNKETQRKELSQIGIPVPLHLICHSFSEVEGFSRAIPPPFVLKASRYGYDGRGVIFVDSLDQLKQVLGDGPFTTSYVMEPHLEIRSEFAIVTVTSLAGEVSTYPALQTTQKDGICVEVSTDLDVSEEILNSAKDTAIKIAQHTKSVGVQAVEFFLTTKDELLVNELAPRVHNSAHLSIEACITSQFENHLRAILALPIGSTSLLSHAVMVNLIGPSEDKKWQIDRNSLLADPTVKAHLYGKTIKPKRKVGHVTALDSRPEQARKAAWEAARNAFVEVER